MAFLFLVLSGLLVWSAGAPTPAHAHGGPPRTRAVVFHPTDPDRVLLQTSYGLLLSEDGAGSFVWVCPQAASWGAGANPPFVISGSGEIFAAVFAGLSRGDAAGCAWDFPVGELDRRPVSDVRLDPSDPRRLLVVESSGGGGNRIFASTDGGDTFTQTAQQARDVLYETLRFAPSDPTRAYLSGGTNPTETDPRSGTLFVSNDGGDTFPIAHPVDVGEDNRLVRVVGVDPTHPDTVFIVVTAFAGDDELRRSTDGGARFETVAAIPVIRGFAIGPDGDDAWVTGFEGGLQRSVDGGATFDVLDPELDLECLEHDGTSLWACGQADLVGFGLARSADRGASFETVFADQDIAPRACDEGTTAAAVCPNWIPDLCFDLDLDDDFCPVPEPQDAGPPDGGPPGDGGGGSCAVGGDPRGLGGALAGALPFAGRRRRRRSARRRWVVVA